MKLSEVSAQQDRTDTIIALRDERRDIASLIAQIEGGDTARISVDYATSVQLSEGSDAHVIAALRQEMALVEKQLTDLGVELDEAADFQEPSESEDVEEAA